MTSKILNIVLGIAVVILAIQLTLAKQAPAAQDGAADGGKSALEVIAQRSSIRAYSDKPVEDEKVEKMLRAAMAAPTARDQRPWAFMVIRDKAKLSEIADSLPFAKMARNAQLAIVVCGDLTKALKGKAQQNWVLDTSAATENLLLAATAQGLGAVWTGVYPSEERMATAKSLLGMPDSIMPLCIVPVGYPAGEATPKDKWNPANVHYDKW